MCSSVFPSFIIHFCSWLACSLCHWAALLEALVFHVLPSVDIPYDSAWAQTVARLQAGMPGATLSLWQFSLLVTSWTGFLYKHLPCLPSPPGMLSKHSLTSTMRPVWWRRGRLWGGVVNTLSLLLFLCSSLFSLSHLLSLSLSLH